jgi:hypothetical protein
VKRISKHAYAEQGELGWQVFVSLDSGYLMTIDGVCEYFETYRDASTFANLWLKRCADSGTLPDSTESRTFARRLKQAYINHLLQQKQKCA